MENEKVFTNEGIEFQFPQAWNSIFGMGIQDSSEVNSSSLNPNCDPFESALSSIVSSPANSHAGIHLSGAGDSSLLRELIGRLGSICNSGEISVSPQSCINGIPEENKKLGDFMEESSVSETGIKGHNVNSNGRKRKGLPKGKETQSSGTIYVKDEKVVAEVEKDESDAKKGKSTEKSTESPKDYIHVRARRGQATDSHSLAERVRREKISERMKFLQGLVPGCNKITGKAVMLDEIINYVQALQQQVEFLSMKLATVNPSMDASIETLLSRDIFRPQVSLPNNVNPYNTPVQPFPYGFQSQINGAISIGPENQFSMNHLKTEMNHGSMIKPSHVDRCFGEASTLWENDLQSVVKMVLGYDEAQGLPGQMKVEL